MRTKSLNRFFGVLTLALIFGASLFAFNGTMSSFVFGQSAFAQVSVVDKKFPSEVVSVAEVEEKKPIKRSVVVRLSRPVSREKLQQIADIIHEEKPSFDRTFIEYLIQGMTYGAGAWATTHFNPSLKVEILGPTLEQLKNVAEVGEEGIVGRWIGRAGSVYILKHSGDRFLMTQSSNDGSEIREHLKETHNPRGKRYDPIDDTTEYGEYYLLRKDGVLELGDSMGIFYTAPMY